MHVELSKSFRFEAAHLLPNVPDGHKCRRLHGHSFRFAVTVAGAVNPAVGWLLDYADIQAAVAPLHAQLDHRYLNDIDGLANPTSENLARWLWERLRGPLPGLTEVVVRETCTSSCRYRGN